MTTNRVSIARRKLLQGLALTPLAAIALSSEAEAQLEKIIDRLTENDKDKEHMKKIMNTQWAYVEMGATFRLLGTVPMQVSVIQQAATLSESHLKDDKGKFDKNGQEFQTNICAVLCGYLAADNAAVDVTTTISELHYLDAFNEVKAKMGSSMARLRSQKGDPNYGKKMGYGC